jgi:formylglycine-generating enzyme required for sulfatase activity
MRYWALILSTACIFVATPAAPAAKSITGSDGAPMVHVPAGWFIMGSNQYADEKPRRRVYLDGFYIDKYEVTSARFRAAGMIPDVNYGSRFNGASQPVVGVTWHQAKAYCEKAGKRLPTEAEWEKAARGTDGRKYPWGNSWDASKLIHSVGSSIRQKTHPVDRSYSTHASHYGAVDMAGNVWEWVNDWYGKDYYRNAPDRNPKGPDAGSARALRGGSWDYDNSRIFRAAFRAWDGPYDWIGNIGFRCAKALR